MGNYQHAHLSRILGVIYDRYFLGSVFYVVKKRDKLLWARLPLILLLEFAPFGNLKNHLRLQPRRLPLKQELAVVYQLAEAVSFLHGNRVIHRDLAARNVLVFQLEPICVKLADFGCKFRIERFERGSRNMTWLCLCSESTSQQHTGVLQGPIHGATI